MKRNTVLIVDDETDIRESLRDVLADEGYTVMLASNGQEALELLPSLPRPCGIILDIRMPVMSGPDFYKAMRAAPAYADIPVVISSSDLSTAPIDVPAVKKPIDVDRLLDMVAALF